MQHDAATVGPEASVGEIARIMTETPTAHVVVTGEDGHPAGIISARDLVARHAKLHFPTYFALLGYTVPIETRRDDREIEKALATTARDLMSKDLITVDPDADVDQAATLMLDRDVSCLPVVQEGRLAGIITEADIVKLLVVEEG